MDDDIAGIDQDPVAVGHALDAHREAGLRQVLEQMIRDCPDLTVRPPGGHHHGVGNRSFAGEIDCDGVLGFHIADSGEDEAKRLLGVRAHLGDLSGGATCAGPGECRYGQGSFPFAASPAPPGAKDRNHLPLLLVYHRPDPGPSELFD